MQDVWFTQDDVIEALKFPPPIRDDLMPVRMWCDDPLEHWESEIISVLADDVAVSMRTVAAADDLRRYVQD